MTSKVLIDSTRKYIIENPQHKEYSRKGEPLEKVMNTYKCSLCSKFEHPRILATAAHIKRDHADKINSNLLPAATVVTPSTTVAASISDKESHELHFDDIPTKNCIPEKKEVSSLPSSQKKKPLEPNEPADDDEEDDWLDWLEN